ncbi:Mu transposase C-terminal domain-containing protein, partial [Duganella callida]
PDGAALPAGRPGAGFYLDAVRAEVQLVSRADRQQAIGRPLVYVVTDLFSRMVTGVYVTLGEAQWPHAMLALAHCGADKQQYSQHYGRRIEAEQWPCRHLPEALFVNAALTLGWSGDTLLNNFNLRCVAADEGPDDWRELLARRFRLLPPGADGVPCRLDGVLDLDQFTRIVIDCVLYYNNRCQLAHAGGLTPRQLWHWGREHRGGGLKIYPEQLLRCSLMPVGVGTVSADGIQLFDTLYTCARAINERWFERARLRAPWSVKLAYDPSNLDTVYLLDAAAPMQFHACHMVDSQSARRLLSVAEVARLPRAAAAATPLRSTTQSYAVLTN